MSNIKDTNFQAMSEYWNANISRVIKVNGKYIPIADDKFLDFVTATAGDIASGKTGADEHGYPVFGTYKPSGGSSGTFDLAKVTEYTPYAPAVTGLSQIVVSGLGDDYDSANGTYNVTAETKKESDIFKRIYKHTSGEWYIWGEYEPEYEEGYWYIGVAPDSGDLVYYTSEELTDGEYYFENWDTGDSYDVALDVTKTNYPESPMVLKGVKATGYHDGECTFSTAETDFIGFDAVPQVGLTYAVFVDSLVGKSIDTMLLKLSFDGDDVLADSSSYAHIVTQEDGEVLSEGYSGNAWDFDGGFLKIEPKGNEFVFGTNDFTIEAYIYPTSDRRQCIFAYWMNDRTFAISFSYDEDCRINVFGGKQGWNNRNVSDPLELNRWYHVAFVRKGNTLTCYIDGKPTGYTVDMTNVNVGEQMAVSFGRWVDDPGDFDARWRGYMDDIRISNVARY